MIKTWAQMSARERLAMLDLMQATMQAELQPFIDETNVELEAAGCPAKLEIEIRFAIDPNRDPRLTPNKEGHRRS